MHRIQWSSSSESLLHFLSANQFNTIDDHRRLTLLPKLKLQFRQIRDDVGQKLRLSKVGDVAGVDAAGPGHVPRQWGDYEQENSTSYVYFAVGVQVSEPAVPHHPRL
jgi:hypothetical protein